MKINGVEIPDDPHERQCVGCKGTFNPFSMAIDKNIVVDVGKDEEGNIIRKVVDEEIIVPPEQYECVGCRNMAAA